MISLLVFVVLNFASATRARTSSAPGTGARARTCRPAERAYRLFKQQFNLDKPILFNTRFNLRTEDVAAVAAADVNLSGDVPPGDRIDAQETIDNWGTYAIPALVDILQNHPERRIRSYAALRLASSGQQPLLNQYGGEKLTPEEKALNNAIYAENTIRQWTFGPSDTEAKETDVREKWVDWFAQKRPVGLLRPRNQSEYLLRHSVREVMGQLAPTGLRHFPVDKRPVLSTVPSKLKYSITLSFSSVILVYLLSVPLGIGPRCARTRSTASSPSSCS